MIWIDVHHVGENSTNMTCMLPTHVHVRPAYASYGQSPYVAIFCEVFNSDRQNHHSQENGLPAQSPAHRLTDPWVHTQFLSQGRHWRNGGKATLRRQPATRITRLISPACERYVQYLLTGDTPSILNRHRQGLQPWRCWLDTYHSPTFPTNCLHFPLRAPPGLQFNQVPSTKPKCWLWRTYDRNMVFRPPNHLP
jgi:hypothetical protein